MKISIIALAFLSALMLPASYAFSQMPQDYLYVEGFWGSAGSEDGQLNSPHGIALSTNGVVFVADTANHRIQVFQPDGTFVRNWGSVGSGDGQFSSPGGIAVDTNDLIYVTDISNHRIQVFQSDGTFVRKWGANGAGDGQFSSPRGIVVGPDGLIYVADTSNHRIQVFQSDGTFVSKWGSVGSGDGQFNNPYSVVVATNGLVYVVDTSNSRIQVFQPDGTFVRKWGSYGTGASQFRDAYAIAVDKNQLIYVADSHYYSGWTSSSRMARIQVFSPDGTFVCTWGNYGSSVGQFGTPFYIALDTNGLIYVADTQRNRVQIVHAGYRTPATGFPLPGVAAVTQRVEVAYVDIDYTVMDRDSANVQVAALGFVNGTFSLDNLVRLDTFLEGTSNNIGTNIAANVPHRLTWDAGADWNVGWGNITFEILANDGRPMVDFHFITIPSNGPDPELEIERFPMREADFQSCWYWLIATRDPAIDFRSNKVYGVGGAYADKLLAQTTTTTADGRAFLFERFNVREATAAEVNRARAGTTGTINQWVPRYPYPTDRRNRYNEFGFDSAYTQGAGVWYVVPLP